jgi:tetratricopeptide (TPR) repeat protein
MNSMAAMFFILSLIFYILGRLNQKEINTKYIEPHNWKRIKVYTWFTGCFLGGVFAVACKQNAATLPIVILVYELFFFKKHVIKPTKNQLLFGLGAIIIFSIVAWIFLGENPLDKFSPSKYCGHHFTIPQRLLSELRVVIYYLSLLFYPHPSRLNLLYDYPISYTMLNPPTTLICFLAILISAALVILSIKKNRIIAFCILWFFGNLVIESSFIGLDLVYEHRTYLPSMMICFIFVLFLYRYSKRKFITSFFLSMLALFFSLWTYQRNGTWTDDLMFWKDSVKKAPNNALAINNLGHALLQHGNYEKAISQFEKAIQKISFSKTRNDNSLSIIYRNLGDAKYKKGDINEALFYHKKAIESDPSNEEAYIRLAIDLIKINKIKQAQIFLNKAITINPSNPNGYTQLGLILLKYKQLDLAMNKFKKALQLAPYDTEAHNNLANVYVQKHFTSSNLSGSSFENTVRIAHDRFFLTQALNHYQISLDIDPHNAKTYNNLANLFFQDNQYNKAVTYYKKALQINPQYKAAKMNLKALIEFKKTQKKKPQP